MADYTKTTNFTAKDALTTGDPNKVIKGSEHDTEYDNMATASATKANKIISGTTNGIIIQTAGGDLANGTKTLPTGDVVGLSDTQTLTNKTIVVASNTVTTAASGNLTSTNLNAALAELQTDVDTRATSSSVTSDISTHASDTSTHGVGVVVGTTETQTLTGKTYDADATGNVLTNIEDANIKTGAAINAAKVGTGVVSNTEYNRLNGVTQDISTFYQPSGTDVPITDGGTGSSTAAGALTNLGLTATAAEINKMDGVTASTAEINLVDGLTATTAELNLNDGAVLRHKVIDIGDWDMNATQQVTVAHGLTLANIRTLTVLIRRDDNATYFALPNINMSITNNEGMWVDATNITLSRGTSGTFDSTLYDSTSYNRGWVTIQYVD